MDSLSRITGYVRNFLTLDNWPTLLAILAALVLLILVGLLVYYRIRKRRHPGTLEIKAGSSAERKALKKEMPASSLTGIWKEFLKAIPWSIRPNIMTYEHFIVFGQAGSGKSTLIDRYTDWQGHARQFYPSFTANPLLQIYLGSKVLVQEIPASLLDDTSEAARRALLKLWKPLFRRRKPTVVIALNAMELSPDEPGHLESLRQKAQMIRGKINLLGQICKKPIPVRLVLTHLDQFEGFLEFSRFLAQGNIPLKLEWPSAGGDRDRSGSPGTPVEGQRQDPTARTDRYDLSGCLDPCEEHLTRALISLPADQYLRAMTFLCQAPRVFQDLSLFVRSLQEADPLSLEPEITGFYLTSQAEENLPVLNPFAPLLTAEEISKIDPHRRHRLAAAAIGLAGLLFFGAAYFHGRSLIVERQRGLDRVETDPPARYDQRMHELLPAVYADQHPVTKVLPDFFSSRNREITHRSMENIRELYLLPELDRLATEMAAKPQTPTGAVITIHGFEHYYKGSIHAAQDRAVYLLALIYATRDNDLGQLIQQNPTSWSKILNLPRTMIEDYVHNNVSSSDVSLAGKKLSFRQSHGAVDDPNRWMAYFREIRRFCQQPFMSRMEFEKLQKDTEQFLGVIQQMELYDLTVRLAKLLKKEVPPDIHLDMIVIQESELRQEAIKNSLNFIKNSSMNYPETAPGSGLAGLLENLKVMLSYKDPQAEKDWTFRFSLGGEDFSLSAGQWKDLINRSRINAFLRDFVNQHQRQDGLLFFPSDQEFDDLIMNPSNDGRFLFIGSARVDGRFTRDAVEKRVRPILSELPALIESLPIDPQGKKHVTNFLLKEVDIYGRRYAQSYRRYYTEFDIKAGSPGALRFVLSQMVLPSSPLREVLVSIQDNIRIDPGTNEYMQIFSRHLSEFDFIKRLMGEQKGTFPELDRYKALMEQMLADIQEQQGQGEKRDKEESHALLKNRLSPLGRIAFAILDQEKDSYVNLVKRWLESVAVPRPWQDIFLAPVWQAYFLGMAEIESDIAKTWEELRQADIQPLQHKFPFLPASGEDVSIEELRNATHPAGHFRRSFQALLLPYCGEEGQRWRKRSSPYNVLKLPETMLPTLNAIEQLGDALWDRDGKEKFLEFMVRPAPLPLMPPREPLAALSYLYVGDSAVFGFNQKPSWKRIRCSWKDPSSAAVGIEFAGRSRSARIKRTIEVPPSYWSFYRLLQKAKQPAAFDRNRNISTVQWTIMSPAGNGEGVSLDIAFDIKGDPWSVFKLPR
jgi:hypothetical protein